MNFIVLDSRAGIIKCEQIALIFFICLNYSKVLVTGTLTGTGTLMLGTFTIIADVDLKMCIGYLLGQPVCINTISSLTTLQLPIGKNPRYAISCHRKVCVSKHSLSSEKKNLFNLYSNLHISRYEDYPSNIYNLHAYIRSVFCFLGSLFFNWNTKTTTANFGVRVDRFSILFYKTCRIWYTLFLHTLVGTTLSHTLSVTQRVLYLFNSALKPHKLYMCYVDMQVSMCVYIFLNKEFQFYFYDKFQLTCLCLSAATNALYIHINR